MRGICVASTQMLLSGSFNSQVLRGMVLICPLSNFTQGSLFIKSIISYIINAESFFPRFPLFELLISLLLPHLIVTI